MGRCDLCARIPRPERLQSLGGVEQRTLPMAQSMWIGADNFFTELGETHRNL